MPADDRKKLKQDKRAAALRDNLRRRKQQAKERDTKDDSPKDTSERKK
jgi:hypothetical protein